MRADDKDFRRIVEAADEGVWVLDKDARTTYANPRMASMLATTPEEMRGASMWDFIDEEWQGVAGDNLERRRGGVSERHAFCFRRRDGQELWAYLSASPLFDEASGQYLGALAFVSDATEVRRLEDRLLTCERLASLGLLAAGVVHDLNNPLTALYANLEEVADFLAARDDEGAQRALAEVGYALEAAEQIRALAQDLRVFARGGVQRVRPVDVEKVLESALRVVVRPVRHQIRLIKDVSPTPPVRATESGLAQVFLNLLANAVDALSEREHRELHVALRTSADGQGVEVEVRDTGAGMPEEVQRRAFTPFFTTKDAGSGLGLFTSQRIVTSIGGDLEIHSREGQGTTVRVRLPALVSEAGPAGA